MQCLKYILKVLFYHFHLQNEQAIFQYVRIEITEKVDRYK